MTASRLSQDCFEFRDPLRNTQSLITMLKCHSTSLRIAIAVLTLTNLYYISYHYRHHGSPVPHANADFFTHSKEPTALQEFTRSALAHQVSDPFDISAISRLCCSRTPRDDVIVSCTPGTGGVGNIRSYMLHCMRFAM